MTGFDDELPGPNELATTGSQRQPAPDRHTLKLGSAAECIELGERIGALLRGGDLVVLSGPVGAGKTTLTRGLAAGVGVQGRVSSPTFVIARHHPAAGSGPDLIHVDAYRLSGPAELEALDLEADLDRAVMVVEWGREHADQLASSWLQIELARTVGYEDADGNPDTRTAAITWHGAAWDPRRVSALRAAF